MELQSIKPQELRIGNFVEVENYEIIQLENVHPKGTTKGDEIYLSSMLKPIEITEQWLLKLGYERDKNEYCVSGFDRFNVYQTVKGSYIFCDDEKSIRYVRYVHELQNIFFALTGEELKIKEP